MSINRIDTSAFIDHLGSNSVILVPNNRLRDAVLHSIAEQQPSNVFLTPTVLGIDVWVRDLWDLTGSLGKEPYCSKQPISGAEELFIWTEIIEDSLDTYPLLNPEETATQVSHAYQLMKQWRLHERNVDELQAYTVIPDIAAFLAWSEEFEIRCAERQVISLVDCIDQLTHDLQANSEFPFSETIVLLNFYQPPPLYAELFDALRNRVTVTDTRTQSNRQVPEITHHVFADQRSEFQHVANWAKALTETQHEDHIGILGELNDEQKRDLLHIISCTLNPRQILSFNSTQRMHNGSADTQGLLDEPCVHDAFLLFQLVIEEQDAESFCRLLRSPFVLPASDEQTARYLLEEELRQRVTRRCRLQDLSYYIGREDKPYFCPTFSAAMLQCRELFRRAPQRLTPDRWVNLLLEILNLFGWPGDAVSQPQKQAIKQFHDCLEKLSALTPLLAEVDYSKLVSRLKNLCHHSSHQQPFDGNCPISVYSLTEASGLHFDHVWILNFNDQVWPNPISPSPFLPYALQKDAGMPGSHTDVQFSDARDTFDVITGSVSSTLHTSHHCSDGDQEFRASSFSKSHTVADGHTLTVPDSLISYNKSLDHQVTLNIVSDDPAVPLETTAESLGGHGILSDQSNCPFYAFILHRLHASPLEPFANGLSRAARGTAIHEALEFLFGKVADQKALAKLSEVERSNLCEQSAEHAANSLTKFHRALMTPRFAQMEANRVQQLLQRFIDLELTREPFEILGAEQRLTWIYRDMTFNLKVDRIDRLHEGGLAVIDYKTGKSAATPSSWLQDRPQDLQLPFYLTVMNQQSDETIKAVAIAHVNPERTDYSGVMSANEYHPSLISVETKQPGEMDWQQLSKHFEQKVYEIADEFHQGIATIMPSDYAEQCGNYQIRGLCRIPDGYARTMTDSEDAQ